MIVLNFTEEEIEMIWDSAEENLDSYIEDTSFSISDFLLEKGFEPKNSNIFLKNIRFDMDSESPSSTDFYNGVMLYEALDRDVAPYVASSGAFWTAMVHANLEYMRYRWPLDTKDPLRSLRERYLLRWTTDRRMKERNGMARLWWAVYLTVDKSLDDKYRYTREIMTNQDIMGTVLDREPFNQLVTRAFARVLIHQREKETPVTREIYRGLAKYISSLHGSILLHSLTEDELFDRFNDYVEWKRSHI